MAQGQRATQTKANYQGVHRNQTVFGRTCVHLLLKPPPTRPPLREAASASVGMSVGAARRAPNSAARHIDRSQEKGGHKNRKERTGVRLLCKPYQHRAILQHKSWCSNGHHTANDAPSGIQLLLLGIHVRIRRHFQRTASSHAPPRRLQWQQTSCTEAIGHLNNAQGQHQRHGDDLTHYVTTSSVLLMWKLWNEMWE